MPGARGRPSIPQASVQEAKKLQTAVWHNHLSVLENLLADGFSPDSVDIEAGWTPLHKALFWGRLQAASLLLGAGAKLNIQDDQGRTPIHFLSTEISESDLDTNIGEAYTWGNGSNYQLGSGAEGLQEYPARLESLRDLGVKEITAAKFHSMALTEDGQLYSWGFGRGGRLGQGDFLVHSGEAAIILPQQVSYFSRRKVVSIAASKHHSAAITSNGELFTWGSNRDGRLGYQQIDTQPTPRKVTAFNRLRVVAVALANRHSVAVLDNGVLYSWGSNNHGQLGYGTSDPASNAPPRMLEAMKGKYIVEVAAAKRHTLVLTMEGNVYQWGHGLVTPRRVVSAGRRDVARLNTEQAGKGWEVVFHKGQTDVSKPTAIKICAGAAHSSLLTEDGIVMTWRSMDPTLTPQEVGDALGGKFVSHISAGKYRTAAVTREGEVYMWEGWSKAAEATSKGLRNPITLGSSPAQVPAEWDLPKGAKHRRSGKAKTFQVITPQRVDGLSRVKEVAVGEKHSVALSTWDSAPSPSQYVLKEESSSVKSQRESPEKDGNEIPLKRDSSPSKSGQASPDSKKWRSVKSPEYWETVSSLVDSKQSPHDLFSVYDESEEARSTKGCGIQSLQRLCEICVAINLVEPRTVLQVLEFADAAGAEALRQHCIGVTLSNLDLIFLEASSQFAQLPPHLLADLEGLWCQIAKRSVSPHPSDESEEGANQIQNLEKLSSSLSLGEDPKTKTFTNPAEEAEAIERRRQERTLRKKLQQIEILEEKLARGDLDGQQKAKVLLRPILQAALQALQENQSLKDVKQVLADAQASLISVQSPSQKSLTPISKSLDPSFDKKQKARRKSSLNESKREPITSQDLKAEDAQYSMESPVSTISVKSNEVKPELDKSSVPQTIGFEISSPGRSKNLPIPSTPGFKVSQKIDNENNFLKGSESSKNQTPVLQQKSSLNIPETPVSGKKPGKRRGGLSMFLAGDLDSPSKFSTQKKGPEVPAQNPSQQETPIKLGPSWAQGSKTPVQPSLREILDQQSHESSGKTPGDSFKTPQRPHRLSEEGSLGNSNQVTPSPRPGNTKTPPVENPNRPRSGISIALGDLVKKTAPTPISQPKPVSTEKKGPAWGGKIPLGASPSRLQDIQQEEEMKREHSGRSWGALGTSPSSQRANLMTTWHQGHSSETFGGSPGTTSFPSGSSPSTRRSYLPPQAPQSKWYIKEEPEIVALRSIQTEEAALKELTEFMNANQEAEKQEAEKQAEEEKAKKKKRNRSRKSSGQRRKSENGGTEQRPNSGQENRQHHPPRRKSDSGSREQGTENVSKERRQNDENFRNGRSIPSQHHSQGRRRTPRNFAKTTQHENERVINQNAQSQNPESRIKHIERNDIPQSQQAIENSIPPGFALQTQKEV